MVERQTMSNEKGGPGIGAVFGVSIVTSALVSAGVTLLLAGGLRIVPDEEVPLLTGLSFDAAAGVAEANNLRIVNRGERHDPEIPAEEIVEQRPGAGSRVPRGSEVAVIMSLGPELVTVPDVVGLSPADARARLSTAGLRISPVMDEGGTGTPGTVSSTDPAGAASVPRDSVVVLTVVPAPTGITLADYVGMGSRAAREAIVAAGLVVGDVTHGYDENRNPYVVLRQTPTAGTVVERGSRVNIVINEE